MAIELIPLCTVTARLSAPFILPETPLGTRAIAKGEITEGGSLLTYEMYEVR